MIIDKILRKLRSIKENDNLFNTFSMKFNFTDGSVITSDPITFETFKKHYTRQIKIIEFREATDKDIKETFERVLYLIENHEQSEFFDVQIKGKNFKFYPDKIVSIEAILT